MNDSHKFGALDTKTGLFAEGYMEDSEMKFKKIPWYKKLFTKEPLKEEFIDIVDCTNLRTGETFSMGLYRKINPLTQEVKSLYAKGSGRVIRLDVQAFIQRRELVAL